MHGKNLTAQLHQYDAFTISGFEPKSTLTFKVCSAAFAAVATNNAGGVPSPVCSH